VCHNLLPVVYNGSSIGPSLILSVGERLLHLRHLREKFLDLYASLFEPRLLADVLVTFCCVIMGMVLDSVADYGSARYAEGLQEHDRVWKLKVSCFREFVLLGCHTRKCECESLLLKDSLVRVRVRAHLQPARTASWNSTSVEPVYWNLADIDPSSRVSSTHQK